MLRHIGMAALAVLSVASPPAAAAGAERLSDLERAGAELYHKGKGRAGPIFARIGNADVPLPATALPCASCHGPDGLGRPEGGVEPVPLTWDHLTKPYGHRHGNGREHPPFTEESLTRAVSLGIDPGGNPLDPAMPRFEMAPEDLDALVAYLKHLGGEGAPGVTQSEIVLGVLIPGEGPLAAAGSSAASLLAAYVEQINAQTGIYGRSVVLRTERLGGDPAAAEAAVDRLIEAPVLAMIAAIPPALQPAVAERVEAAAVPVFHLWPPAAEERPQQGIYNFYLLAGLRQEVESLLGFAEERLALDRLRSALVVPPPPREDGAVVSQVADRWPDAARIGAPASAGEARRLVRRLKADGVNLLVILARDGGVATLLDAADESGWFPYVLAPGSLAGAGLRALPAGFDGRVFLAYPTVPADGDERDLARLRSLRSDDSGAAPQLFSEAAAFTAAGLLVEALRAGGRNLSRDGLIAAVEDVYRFDSGVLPPLTFGPNRRIGAAEIRIVRAR